MDDTLRVGLIGCGGLGSGHARNVEQISNASLVAVCDFFRESADRLAGELDGNPKVYSDHLQMLAEQDLDAVLIVTPNDTHSRISVDASVAGAHVFCEKPMALNVEDCDRMIDATEQAGKYLMIGFVRRFQASYAEMKSRVSNGEIGEVTMAQAVRLGTGPPGGREGWQFKQARYGGLFSMYSHELDQLAWLGGEIHSVQAMMKYGDEPDNDIEDHSFITFEFASGAIGSMSSSRMYPVGSYELGVAGTEGAIKMSIPTGPLVMKKLSGETEEIEVPRNNGLVDEVSYFFDCIRSGVTPESDGYDGRRVVAVALAAHKSAQSGRREDVTIRSRCV